MEVPLQQHPTFGAALRMLGAQVDQIDIDGAAPTQVVRRFGVAFAPRGPLWQTENAGALRRSRLRVINAERPSDVYRQAGYRQLMTPAHVAELDLSVPDWIAGAHGKWRNAWRKSQKSKLKITHRRFDADLHHWVLAEDVKQQRAKRFRALPHSVIRAFARVSPENAIVLTACKKRDPVAAMVFLQHGPVATYHLGWSSGVGRATNAHYALLHSAADVFAGRGVTRLDLGTVDTENAPGLARFKIGTGAEVRSLGGTWLRIPGL